MNKFMRIAYDEALSGIEQKHGGPFGAVIVRGGEVIARAHNEVLKNCDPSAHAEVVAIRRACEKLGTVDLGDCALYASAKPCPMCTGAVQWSRIRELYYSGEYEDTEKLGFDDLEFSECDEENRWTCIDNECFGELIDAFARYRAEIRY